MRKIMKIIFIILGIIVVLAIALFLFLLWASRQPAVQPNYYESITTDQPLEQKYMGKGGFEVSYRSCDAENDKIGQFEIWYPSEMESSDSVYPLVVMANGTGVKASRYEAIFEHLASWGFIVIGNEDESSWDGVSSSESLDYLLRMNLDPSSVFYGKIDTENIGVAGHSQGGVGAINAVVIQENGTHYKAIYTASATHIVLANALSWPYDVSRIDIPYFMTAGTLEADAGNEQNAGIAPLWSLQENYEAISDKVMKIYARRVDTDHGDMLANGDSYMTAWFLYHLKGDAEAGEVFLGDDAEITHNANWQDVEKNF